MRLKRKTIAIAILMAAVSALAYAILSRDNEPRYNGKSLSEWLALHRQPEALGDFRATAVPSKAARIAAFRAREARVAATRSEAELAVRAIGTNALPVLLEWIRYELPPWRQKLLKLATQPVEGKSLDEGKIVYGKSLIEGKRLRKAEMADVGFTILYTNAAPAVPALEALMKDNHKPDLGLRAIHALNGIGAPAIPALTNALADTNQINRPRIIQAIFVLERMAHDSHGVTHRSAWLPALNRALDDSDAAVRRQAAITLYNLEHHDEILAQMTDGRAFREYMLRARTNAPKPDLEVLTNAPAK